MRGISWALLSVATVLLGEPLARAETYALLVGIDDYAKARPLRGSVNDIRRIREIAARDLLIPDRNVTVLLNAEATKANILGALHHLATQSKPGDSLLWYYSGHGWVADDVDGDEAKLDPFDKFDEVLVPVDGVPFPKERAFEPNPTFLADDEIAVALTRLVGRRLIVIFDSCHSGTATRSLPGEESGRALYEGVAMPSPPRFRALNQPRETLDFEGQLIFIAAAGASETASDLGDFDGERHGALTASLLRTMRQAGPGWPKVLSWDGVFRQARADMLTHGFASQTPSLAARGGLSKLTVEEFLRPPAAVEISGVPAVGPFTVQLEANKHRFEDGELLEVAVESDREGYLYVFDIDAARKVTQLYPNRFQPENRIAAGALQMIPAKGDRYQLRAGAPFGNSTIVAIVTSKPWTAIGGLDLPDNFQPIPDTQTDGLRTQLRSLQAGSIEWSSQRVMVEIAAKAAPPPPPPPIVTAPPPPPPVTAAAAPSRKDSLDDSDLTPEEQSNIQTLRPALFDKYARLAARFSPVFWQEVGDDSRPWKDFFIRYDFDQTELGPNWPAPPQFQDENKRRRNQTLDNWLKPGSRRDIVPLPETPGVYRVTDRNTGETVQLDLRPTVYWAVLATSTHYFFHYDCFKAEDWKFLFGHPGDLEGTTIVVDRATEKMVAAFTLAHDDVQVTRDLDDGPDANIEVLMDPSLETRALFGEDDGRPVNGALGMDQTRDGGPAPKEHQDIYSESGGHGQYGPHKIKTGHYIVYANYLPDETWRAPSFEKDAYNRTDQFAEVKAKHKYALVYIGSSASAGQKTLWAEYHGVERFPGGANPPWDWRDNLFFKTGWWKDPLTIKKIGDSQYRFNPYR